MRNFISLCMIVKDEEKVLKRCLESVSGIVDEIVIIDTGSSDSTKEIAQHFTSIIYDYQWTNNFADARNFAASKATGEWILILDADEFLDRENMKNVVQKLRNNKTSSEAYSVKIYNFLGTYGEQVVNHSSLRIYKNSKDIHFFRSIHEQLEKRGGELKIGTVDLIIYHSGYLNKTVKDKNKHERNAPLVNKELENGLSRAFDYFNLGNELFSINKTEKALEAYKKAYQNKESFDLNWVSIALIQIVNCLIKLERFNNALEIISDAEKIWPTTIDFKCLKANIYFMQNRLDDAKEEMINLLNNKDKYNNCILNINFKDHHPHFLLGNIYAISNENKKAVFHYVNALNINNIHIETITNLMNVLIKESSEEEIFSFINRFHWKDNKEILIHLVKVFNNVSALTIAGELINLLDHKSIAKQGLLIKYLLVKQDIYGCYEILIKTPLEDLIVILNKDYIDLIDLVILGLLLKNKELLNNIKKFITDKDKKIINFVMEEKVVDEIKGSQYINILERCIQLKQFKLFEDLLNKKSFTDHPVISLLIGHLLHKYQFHELSIDFYKEVEMDKLDVKAYVNIINSFRNNNLDEEALEFCLLALSKEFFDFRIIKNCIELLDKNNFEAEKENILKMSLEYYSDSNWLKDIYIFN
jgi:glycosyltransferase involved in cell wall biosynthesis